MQHTAGSTTCGGLRHRSTQPLLLPPPPTPWRLSLPPSSPAAKVCVVVSSPALLDAGYAIPSTFRTRSSATLPCSNLISPSWNSYNLSTTRMYRASARQLTISKATAIGPCMCPAELRACRAVCAHRSLLKSATQKKPSRVATLASAGTTGSPARSDIPVRNRPALGGERTSAHLVGQRHISTEQADCSTGTLSGLRSWPRSDGASEDAASIKRRLLLNHSAVEQVVPCVVRHARFLAPTCTLKQFAPRALMIALPVWLLGLVAGPGQPS